MATKEIPYGLSDYARLALENYYYVDKTHFIPLIEKAASFFFLIRPRRFGKSLTLSMLEHQQRQSLRRTLRRTVDIPTSYSTAGKVPDSEIQLLGSKFQHRPDA